MSTPYTYLIGWPELNLWYYGVRYARGCHPEDLWKSYFTSSKSVAEITKQHGHPTVREVRKTFDAVEKARLWENKVLRRMKVVQLQHWINKNDRMAPPILAGDLSPMKRPEVAKKSGESKRKKGNSFKSKEWRENHSKTMSGRKLTQEHKDAVKRGIRKTIAEQGDEYHTKTPEFREARREQMTGDKNPAKNPETRAKIGAKMAGKPWSEARRKAHEERKRRLSV